MLSVGMDIVLDARGAGDPVLVLTRGLTAQRESFVAVLETAAAKLGAKRVHLLRISLRRLLSAFELATTVGCKVSARLRRRSERLLLELSSLRDVHVRRRGLERAALPSGVDVSRLSARLRRRERKLTRRAQEQVKALDVPGFERGIRALFASLEAVPPSAASRAAVQAALQGQLARLHLGMQARLRTLPLEGDRARALHRLRIALKNYRYSLEILLPSLPAQARELLATLARLQDATGAARDAQRLAAMVHAQLAGRAARRPLGRLGRQLEAAGVSFEAAAVTALQDAQLAWPLS